MTSFPAVKGKDLVAALGRAGFELIRTKGSHHFVRHPDGRSTVVPVHAGESILDYWPASCGTSSSPESNSRNFSSGGDSD